MTIQRPLVTVYITNYNYGRYVRRAIDSVLTQSLQDFELIVIDDGSTDNSRAAISEYEGHPKVRIIFQENIGLNRSNNIALKASRGRYIMRLDADDYLDRQALLVLSNVLEDNEHVGLVFPDYYYVDADGNVTGQERRHDFEAEVSLLDQPAHGACTMIRKSFLQDVGGYDEEFRCQDGYDLWLRFIERWEVRNVNLPLFYYRRHGSNLTEDQGRIRSTRARIKKAHARRLNTPACPTLAIVPVRGRSVDPGCLALERLGDRALLDWTLDAALDAEEVERVVLTSPDADVLAHGRARYGPSIITLERPIELARENTSLNATIRFVLEQAELDFEPLAIMTLSTETPFRGATYLDESVHTMRIFDVDSVIAISSEDDLFFRHDGGGLVALGNGGREGQIRFERDYLYRKLPGMNLISRSFFEKDEQGPGERIGHVLYGGREAFTVRTRLDLAMAHVMLEQGAQ